MLFSPEGVNTCLVDNVTESGKFVLQSALPDELVQLYDYFAIQSFPLFFCACWWEIDLLAFSVDELSEFFVRILSVDFLSTVVLNLALVFRRLTCLSSALLLIRRSIQAAHFSPVDLHPSFGGKSSATYTLVVHFQMDN